jgi:hypothetical protein
MRFTDAKVVCVICFNKRDLLGRDGAPRDIPNRSLDPVPWDLLDTLVKIPNTE